MDKECRFCQCELKENLTFKLIEPSGNVIPFCQECAEDMIRHLSDGQAEYNAMNRIANDYGTITPNTAIPATIQASNNQFITTGIGAPLFTPSIVHGKVLKRVI